jgi:glucose-6-phosphate isomerase
MEVPKHIARRSLLHLRDCSRATPRGDPDGLPRCGYLPDYSKNRITDTTLSLLVQLAEESGLRARIDAMFRGEAEQYAKAPGITRSCAPPEARPFSWKAPMLSPGAWSTGQDGTLLQSRTPGEWKGHSGKRIRNIVNIGIGGSHLDLPWHAALSDITPIQG